MSNDKVTTLYPYDSKSPLCTALSKVDKSRRFMLCVNFIYCILNRREYEGKCYKNEGKERMSTRAVHLWLVEFARGTGWRDIHSPSELPEIHRTRDGSINSLRQGHTRCKHMSVSEASLSHFTSLVGVWKEKNKRWPPMLICGTYFHNTVTSNLHKALLISGLCTCHWYHSFKLKTLYFHHLYSL